MNPALPYGALKKPVKKLKAKKPIRKASKPMSRANARYNRIAAKFKREHPICQAHHLIHGLLGAGDNRTQDVHHSRGKLGELRFDTRFFIPVCRYCHAWIENNKERARTLWYRNELGILIPMLCQQGEWNTMPIDCHECNLIGKQNCPDHGGK